MTKGKTTGAGEPGEWHRTAAVHDRFVGREEELADLWERLNQAVIGHGQVAFVRGQAGSGKTALVHHFLRRAFDLQTEFAVGIGACNAQTGVGDPYLPFREALLTLTGGSHKRQISGLPGAPEPATGRTALVRSVQVLVEVAPDLIGLFVPGASLVGAVGKAVAEKMGWVDRLDDMVAPSEETAPDRARIIEQYTRYIQRLSEDVPVLIFVDDLQWADDASLSLFFHIARGVEQSRVILLGAYRASDVALGRGSMRHPLESIAHELTRYYGGITIDLDHIPDIVSRHFVDAIIDAEPNRLGEDFRQALYGHTQGHALFTVELLDMMRRRGSIAQDLNGEWIAGPEIDWQTLPPRAEGIIGERIDRLDVSLRETLTIASVEGESFTAEVIARIRDLAARETVRQLSRTLAVEHRLVGPQGTLRVGAHRLSLYRFMHSLFQQYLYESLTDAERAYLHEDVGSVLEALYEGQTDTISAQLARHYELSGRWLDAAKYHLQAANRALRLSGHPEAVRHAEQGLALLRRRPAEAEADDLTLGLQIALAVASISSNGYNCPQAHLAFDRARHLARDLGDAAQELAAFYGLCLVSLLRGDLRMAHDLSEKLSQRAAELGSATYVMGAEVIDGAAEMFLGRLDRARASLEAVLARYDLEEHSDLGPQLTWDPAVAAQAFLSWILWQQGYADQAIATAQDALSLARRLGHPFSIGQALSFLATLHHMLGDPLTALTYAEEAQSVGRGGSYYAWEATGGVARGLALAYADRIEDGVTTIRDSMAVWEHAGAALMTDYFESALAQACLLAGDQPAGLRALDAADGPVEAIWWQPERQRVRARLLLLSPGHQDEAESLLRESLSLSRNLHNHASELRSTLALARLLRDSEQRCEAVRELEKATARFAESDDTPDLRDARRLLAASRVCIDAAPVSV